MTVSLDRQFSSLNIIVSELSGSGNSHNINSSLLPVTKLNLFLSNNDRNKAATTLEQIFTGIASRSGVYNGASGEICDSGYWPFINSGNPNYTDTSNNSLFSRLDYGIPLNPGESGILNNKRYEKVNRTIGFSLPMYGAGFGYDINNYFTPANKAVAIQAITEYGGYISINRPNHYLVLNNEISISECTISSYNVNGKVINVLDRDTFVVDISYNSGVNYPSAGKYSAVNLDLYQPSGITVPDGYVNTIEYTDDTQSWRAGPVDLRWDDSRQVWCGSDFFRNDIIYGYLASNISPANGRNNPSAFRINTYKVPTLPIYIESFSEDLSPSNSGGTVINLVPNNLDLIIGDTFYITATQTIYDGTYTLLNKSSDNQKLMIDFPYDSSAASSIVSVGYVSYNLSGVYGAIPRVIDKTYVVYNYDTHLKVSLNNKCYIDTSGCVTKEDDIFVVAIKKGPNDIRPIYIGYGDY